MAPQVVNVGIIGCGEVAQVIHIPVLNQLFLQFRITYLCSSSSQARGSCSQRVLNHVPKTTSDAAVLCASPDVDVVFVLSSDELHPRHTKLALASHKHVFVEKPLAMSLSDARAIVEAEKLSRGRVFVGYMRRYAAGFHKIKDEIKQLGSIVYARVTGMPCRNPPCISPHDTDTPGGQDIIGPNSIFVEQSSTFPQRFTDYPADETQERTATLKKTLQQALEIECKVDTTPDRITQYQNLCSLGSHDLSAMREVLGMPDDVTGASLGNAFWNVLFKYPGYTVSYESGFHNVPSFDACIEVYGEDKSVLIKWDNPFIRGLPVLTTTRQRVDGGIKETHMRKTYEDPFILELKELHAMVTENKAAKTSAEDAVMDIHICQMIIRAAAR